ncbi:MAG: ATP-binding protein [Thermodesulfobacteriota bacterium]|nr:ATP-binding protein [Thermodesulfobacteriota bacterium]
MHNKRYIAERFSESMLKKRNQELAALFGMSNFLSTSMDLEYLLKGALFRVVQYFDLKAGRMYLLDNEGQYLHLIAHQGMEAEGLEKVHIYEGFTGKSARTKAFIAKHVSELEDKNRAEMLSKKGFEVIICVPLISMDKVVGVMNLAASKFIKLDNDKIDLLTTLGNQVAVAANNTRLYEDLNNKLKILKEKQDMLKFFTYSTSHDLKSPAISLYGLTKRLKTKYGDILDEKGRSCCDQIMKTSEQILGLIENINTYIMTKEAPLNLERINVKEIMKEIRNEFSPIFKKRRVTWSEPEAIPEIFADRLAIARVFRNFVDNALKYGGEKIRQLTVTHEENDTSNIFSFTDDGVGIKKHDREKIFDVFQRNETSKGIPGSGLGLAIIKQIAERHLGKAWVAADSKKGTTFYIAISKHLERQDHSDTMYQKWQKGH